MGVVSAKVSSLRYGPFACDFAKAGLGITDAIANARLVEEPEAGP